MLSKLCRNFAQHTVRGRKSLLFRQNRSKQQFGRKSQTRRIAIFCRPEIIKFVAFCGEEYYQPASKEFPTFLLPKIRQGAYGNPETNILRTLQYTPHVPLTRRLFYTIPMVDILRNNIHVVLFAAKAGELYGCAFFQDMVK